jgi:hypothetical protein
LVDYDIGCPIPDTPEANMQGINLFLIIVRGSRILSKSYQTLFSVSATMNSAEQYLKAIDSVRNDMDRWVSSIPDRFRPGLPFRNENSNFALLRLHFVYHALAMALSRLELHVGAQKRGQRMENARKQLMDTARTVVKLTTYIDLKPYTPMWYVDIAIDDEP